MDSLASQGFLSTDTPLLRERDAETATSPHATATPAVGDPPPFMSGELAPASCHLHAALAHHYMYMLQEHDRVRNELLTSHQPPPKIIGLV